MIRDTFFSQTRFVNLCRKEMVENWKSNLLRVALMYGAMAVIMLWSGYLSYRAVGQDTDSTWEFNLVIFMWGLCVFGCLSASFTMERMKSKTGRLSVLMTPATSFEKYFSRWLVFTVVFLIVFLITYKLADYTKVLVYSLVYPENNAIAITPLSHLFGENTDYYTVFKHTVINRTVGFGNTAEINKHLDGFRSKTSSSKSSDGNKTRIIPAVNNTILDKFFDVTLSGNNVCEV